MSWLMQTVIFSEINLSVGLGMRKTVVLLLILFCFAASSMIVSKPAFASDTISWETKSSMNQARAYIGTAVVNGKIYVIGGDTDFISGGGAYPGIISGFPVVSTNEKYDPSTDDWVIMMPMPTARAQFGIAVCQGKIYCMGGYDSSFVTLDSNEVYDPAADSWLTKAPLPTPQSHISANTVNGKIYVIRNDGSPINYVYDPSTNTWDSKTPPPNEIAERYATVVGDKIYCIGYTEDYINITNVGPVRTITKVIETYDPSNDNWSIVTTAPSYVYSENGCGSTSGKYAPEQIYYFEDKATHIFNLSDKSWTNGTAMPSDRLCAAVATVEDTFYVVGGRQGEHGVITLLTASAIAERYVPFGYKIGESTQGGPFADDIIKIEEPNSSLIYPNLVPLTVNIINNMTAHNYYPVFWVNWLGYSLDGASPITIFSFLEPGMGGKWPPFQETLNISDVSDGQHSIEIMANGEYLDEIGAYRYDITSSPVYFTVDTTPPVILIYSIANQTYYSSDIPLNYNVNDSISWIGYSLDRQANVTITGNTTLTGLSEGAHSIIVYSNDTADHMGYSDTVFFSVAKPEPTPTSTPTLTPTPETTNSEPTATPETTISPTPVSTLPPETTPSPTQEPTLSPETTDLPTLTTVVYASAGAASIIAALVIVTMYVRRKRKTNMPSHD